MTYPVARACEGVETMFNFAGSIPVVGAVSGAVRILAGAVQSAVAVVFTGFCLLASSCCGNTDRNKWDRRISECVNMFIHGGLNMIRGDFEMMFGSMGFTSLGLFVLQGISDNRFAPICGYRDLGCRGVYQLPITV